MKLYRFSPILNQTQLLKAIRHTHFSCYQLCKQSFGHYFPNAGNIGIFCHYDDEYIVLSKIREKLTQASNNPDQKYFHLHKPIIIPSIKDVSETAYTHLYIRKPDPYRHHVGDIDFFLKLKEYQKLKQSLLDGKVTKGARIFDRRDLDMIELYDPDIDALGYISTQKMAQDVRVKINLQE